jgi:hypothetical protein
VDRVAAAAVALGASWLSGIWLGTAVNGAKFGLRVNASYIGVAARSNWFIGGSPRICSIERTMSICV